MQWTNKQLRMRAVKCSAKVMCVLAFESQNMFISIYFMKRSQRVAFLGCLFGSTSRDANVYIRRMHLKYSNIFVKIFSNFEVERKRRLEMNEELVKQRKRVKNNSELSTSPSTAFAQTRCSGYVWKFFYCGL